MRLPGPAQVFARRLTLLLALVLTGAAQAASVAVDQWRSELAHARALVMSDIPRAHAEAWRLQAQLPEGATPADRVAVLNVLGRAEVYLALAAEAAEHAGQAIELAGSQGDVVGEAEAQLNMALNFVNGRLPVQTLVAATTRSMALLDGVDRPELLGEALAQTAMMYLRTGQFDEAVTMAMQSLQIARRNKHPLALAYAHQSLLITLVQSGRRQEAREHAVAMQKQAQLAGAQLLEAQATYGLAEMAKFDGDLPRAESLLRDSLSRYRAIGARYIEGQALYGLADLYRAERKPNDALAALAEAQAIYESYSNRLGIWHTVNARSDIELAMGRHAAALADARHAYDLAGEIGLLRYRSESARRVAKVLAAGGDSRRAYAFSAEAAALSDQAARERASARLVEVAERYESESRKQEIAELTRRNEQQTAELQQHAWQQRWLWTVLAAVVVTLAGTAYFLLRLRRSHHLLERTHAELQRSRDHIEERKAVEAAREVALREAERLARARSDFLAQMSHELRTPLNGILGFAQILHQDGQHLTERQARGLGIIQKSGQHLLTLINDILDLARIDARKLELSPAAVELRGFIEVVAEMIRVKADEKGLAFSCRTENLPSAVAVDELRLRQVLLNLLSNAVKFTDAGQVSLSVAGQPRGERAVTLRFEVSDSGIGMSESHLARLFQPFEQVSDARRRASGAGLGLAISRQLVRLMGSDIEVQSEPGHGSVFRFALELLLAASAPVEQPSRGRIVGYHGPRKKVLVIDDAPSIRTLLRDVLQPLGFEVVEAVDGQSGLSNAVQHRPDLVVMDMSMPVMDGCEATRLMRSLPDLAEVPLIATSASATREVEARFREAGATRFLPKPLETRQLIEAIGEELALPWIVEEPVATASA